MANPFDFSSGDVLTAAQLNSIGSWTAYTPTFGNITLGSGGAAATIEAAYAEVNDIVCISGRLIFGSGTSITGNVSISVPVTAENGINLANGISLNYLDFSTSTYFVGRGRSLSTTAFYAYTYYAASTYTSLTDISDNTKPFASTWTTNDRIYFNGMYRAA